MRSGLFSPKRCVSVTGRWEVGGGSVRVIDIGGREDEV